MSHRDIMEHLAKLKADPVRGVMLRPPDVDPDDWQAARAWLGELPAISSRRLNHAFEAQADGDILPSRFVRLSGHNGTVVCPYCGLTHNDPVLAACPAAITACSPPSGDMYASAASKPPCSVACPECGDEPVLCGNCSE